jgi:hypothetical protein
MMAWALVMVLRVMARLPLHSPFRFSVPVASSSAMAVLIIFMSAMPVAALSSMSAAIGIDQSQKKQGKKQKRHL